MSKKPTDLALLSKGTSAILKDVLTCYRYTLKELKNLSGFFWVNFTLGIILCIVSGIEGTHLWLLHQYIPFLFTTEITGWLYRIKTVNQLLFLVPTYFFSMFYLVGLRVYLKVKKCEKAFVKVGIRNAVGEFPKVINYTETCPYRSKVRILTDGQNIDAFTKDVKALESSIGSIIENVQREEDPRFVDIFLTKRKWPKRVLYSEVRPSLTEPYSFIVGQSQGGLITQDLSALAQVFSQLKFPT